MNTFNAQSEIIDTKLKEISSLIYIHETFRDMNMNLTVSDTKGVCLGATQHDLLKTIKNMTDEVLKDIKNRDEIAKDKSGDNKKSTRVHFYTTVDDENLDSKSIDDLMEYNTSDFDYDAISDFIHRMNRLGHH